MTNERSTYEVVRRWVLLVAGVIVLIYALWPPLETPLIPLAGGLLGLDPMILAAS